MRVQVVLMTGLVEHLEGGGSGGGVVADAFGVEQAPVGSVADLGQRGEVRQLFADAEVARLVSVVSVRSALPSFRYCLTWVFL